jgi:hypothetical protein
MSAITFLNAIQQPLLSLKTLVNIIILRYTEPAVITVYYTLITDIGKLGAFLVWASASLSSVRVK